MLPAAMPSSASSPTPPGVAIIDSTYLLEQQRSSLMGGTDAGLDECWGSDLLATELESMSLLEPSAFGPGTSTSGNVNHSGFGLSGLSNIMSANASRTSAGGAIDSTPASKHNSGALHKVDLGATRSYQDNSQQSLFSIISSNHDAGSGLHSWTGPGAVDSSSSQLFPADGVHSLSTAEGYLDLPSRLPNRSAPASANISKSHSLVSNSTPTSTSGGHAVGPGTGGPPMPPSAPRMALSDILAGAPGTSREGLAGSGLARMSPALPPASASGPNDPSALAPPPPAYASPRAGPRGEAKSQRGQGYRKLWQQVTKVGKGQKLKDTVSGQSDVTVEDLVRIVMKLAPQESAVQAVEQGLYYLDSSALAALLKELAKQGHLRRSVEIFDWLRGLEQAHELSHLCDLYTYTTMISQCGSHQQLRRALELVAEMRSKGITCNVHTYSALMNVCIKANELELAQDVFDQMIEEGCTPNLVTYNILIDVHVKNGQWEEAVARLDTLERQGIQAEVRTYNTVISACNKSGQPEQALKIYDRMLAAGLKPSATTFTALISAYGKRGMVDKAMEIYQDMIRRGCERNVITYSSLISACEKAGQWELAMDLFHKMHREGCKPNVVTYNSLIAACAHGGHWEKATELFEQMQKEGCKPDGITFAALISAYEKGGQWRRALQGLEHMQAQGCHPDAAVFNSLMDVLWQSGVVLAQVRALQLWSLANRNGQFRIYINSRSSADHLQYSTLAFTGGAIYVTVLRWLAELRTKLVKDGPSFFRSKISLSLHKSKQAARSPDTSGATQESLAAMLRGAGSPLVVSTAEAALVVEAPSSDLIAWLRTPEFGELVFLTQGASLKKLTLEMLFAEDIALSQRCVEAFAAVRRVEDTQAMNLAYYNPVVLQQRSQVVHLALKYVGTFGFKGDAVYDGLQLFDKVQCSGMALNANLWPLVLCVSVLLAGRQADRSATWPSYEQIALLTGFSPEAITQMERNVMLSLRQDLSCISVLRVMQLCLERLGFYLQGELGHFKLADHVAKDMHSLLVKVACSPITIGVRPSMLAAATLVVLRKLKGTVPFWPISLQLMTGYMLQPGSDLHTCVMHIEGLL